MQKSLCPTRWTSQAAKEAQMSDIYIIKLTTNDGGEYTGKMSQRQPELVDGFF